MRRICLIGLTVYLFYLGAVTLAPFHFQFSSQPHRWERSIEFSSPDVVANLLLFIPLGGLLYGLFPDRRKRTRLILALFFSATASFFVETMQLFLPGRYSSFSDLFFNTLGGGVGFLLFKAMVHRGWLHQIGHYRRGLARLGFLLYVGFLLFLTAFSWEKLDRWDPNAFLWVGVDSDKGDAWRGTLYLLAVYDHAFDSERVQRHYRAGISSRPEISLQEDPIVLYSFDEREGTTLHDRAGILPPLDLELSRPAGGKWLSPVGYTFNRSASFISRGPAEKVRQRISSEHRFAVEAWIEVGSLNYGDVGRLLSLAKSPDIDYFVLQQQGEDFSFEIRNRMKIGYPYWGKLETRELQLPPGPAHLIAVYDRGETRLYVNGIEVAGKILTDGLFLMTDSLALRTTKEGERGLLGFLLFFPLGWLPILSVRTRTIAGFFLISLSAWVILVAVHLLQSRHIPVFFTGGSILAPALAVLLGALSGNIMQETLQRSSDK